MKKISIIMPTYMGSEYLKEVSIPSVIKQTYTNWELVVVGDGTTDNTQDVVNSFNDSRIKYENMQRPDYKTIVGADSGNIGSSFWNIAGVFAVNRGLDLCNGDYIAHLDQDDYWTSNHLEITTNYLENNDTDLVYTIAEIFNGNRYIFRVAKEFSKQKMLEGNFIYHSSVVYRSSAFKQFKYPTQTHMPVDWQMWVQLTKNSKNDFKLLNTPTLLYFQKCSVNYCKDIIKKMG